MTTLVLCSVCDDAIGIYEPLVVLNGGDMRRTSLAVEPLAADGVDAAVHRDCVTALRVSGPRGASPAQP
jgi:hypothetical protein